MSLRLEMLQTARRAPKLLDDAVPLVHNFLMGQLHADGGFLNRAGQPDLYYTVFGLDSLLALGAEPPYAVVERYLQTFGSGEKLDLVHLSCLIRCWSLLPPDRVPPAWRAAWPGYLREFRAADGGYSARRKAAQGTVYGCFMAVSTYENLGAPVPEAEAIMACLQTLQCSDGAYANDPIVALGTTPTTAAVITLQRNRGVTPLPAATQWLLARAHPQGGFVATAGTPMPDLLSTAVALHALAQAGVDFAPLREKTLDFLDSLWTNQGGFHGTWADDALDCEYAYYALLALGHMAAS